MGAPQLHLSGLFPIAHEGVDVMPGAQQRVEYRRTDVPGTAGEKNSHRYCRPLSGEELVRGILPLLAA